MYARKIAPFCVRVAVCLQRARFANARNFYREHIFSQIFPRHTGHRQRPKYRVYYIVYRTEMCIHSLERWKIYVFFAHVVHKHAKRTTKVHTSIFYDPRTVFYTQRAHRCTSSLCNRVFRQTTSPLLYHSSGTAPPVHSKHPQSEKREDGRQESVRKIATHNDDGALEKKKKKKCAYKNPEDVRVCALTCLHLCAHL